MLTKIDFCDYDTCVALSELGCPVPKYATINIHTKEKEWKMWLPLYEAQKWLREEKRICVEVDCCAGGYVWELCKAYNKDWFSGGTTIYVHYCEDNSINTLLNDCGKYESYEDALLEGIKEVVKILKDEQTN